MTDYDVFLLRRFCADELKKYLRPMRDFWAHSSSYTERPPGDYPLPDSSFARDAGYRIEKRHVKEGPFRNIAAYPYVRAKCLRSLVSGGSSRQALKKAFDDPVRAGEFYCILKGDILVAFLTEEAYAMTLADKAMEASVLLGREEAYAILSGQPLLKTRNKLKRLFDMEEGEWRGKTEF